MADEQIIYISPEEELTNVRERLERAAARRIILVIPPQTQLRSHVGWRLLHSRTREMGKDVVINSSDRQIRAVAKAAGFRVADSLESPTTGKSRPASRPGRNVGGGKAPSRPRNIFNRGTSENRPTAQRGATPRGYVPSNDRPLTQLSPQPPQTHSGTDNMISPGEEISSEAGSSTFGSRNNPYGQDFEYRIDTAPSIHPLSPPFEDEEPDLLIDDFKQAQNIRQAAQMGTTDAARTKSQEDVMHRAPTQDDLDDPLAYREDFQPSSLPEQHGSVPMDELDTDVPDIGDVPTSIIVDGEIEDLGDEGDIVDPYTSSPRTWSESVMEEPEGAINRAHTPDEGARFIAPEPEQGVYGTRPRNSRSANVPPPPYEDTEDEDMLMPPEQPIRPAPPTRGGVPPITVGNRPPQPIITPQPRTSGGAPAARPTPVVAKQSPASTRPRTVRPPVTGRPAPRRRNTRGVAFILATIVLILLVLGILLILIPSADITVTLPSQSFSPAKPLTVTATSTSREDTKLHTVPAQSLLFNKTVGPLSGTVQVGGEATGYVAFTNNGSQPLIIPTNTVVATKSGVQFLTQGQFVVPSASTFPAVPITAQNAGTIGNVAAGTITVIPSSSINAIAQANNNIPSTSVNLTVTNPNPTSHGQAGSTGNGTTNAINALKQQLHQQMQSQFKTWLKGQLHGQDVASRATPDILGSRGPLPEENFPNCSPDANGNLKCTDTLQATVLVVRTADLQTAARAEVNAALASSKQYHGYVLIPQSSLTMSNISSTTSKDGKTLTISFIPKGLIGQNVSNAQLDNLRNLLAGRKVADAKSFLTSSASGLKNVINSQVSLSPGFSSNIPFWTARINIHVQYHCTGKNCSTG